jgi:hypothetical protein
VSSFAANAEMSHLKVSPEDIEYYQRDGIVLVKNVLSNDLMERGRTAIDAAIANAGPQAEFISTDTTWESLSSTFDDDTTGNNPGAKKSPSCSDWIMFQDQFSAKRCTEMMDFIECSPAPQLAATLMQSSTATFFYDHVISKRPALMLSDNNSTTNAIPWHQDLPYWSVSGTLASVWMCFDEMPKGTAVAWVVGSHRWGLYQPRHFVDSSPYEGAEDMEPLPDIDEMVANGKATVKTFDVAPGDALIFDARIIHGSPGNILPTSNNETGSTTPPETQHRRVALRFGGDDAIYWNYDRETAIPTPDIKHGLSHGDKLACKEFPQLWPRKKT